MCMSPNLSLRAEIEDVQNHYLYATIPLYVIMPNHVHLIVIIQACRDALNASAINADSDAYRETDARRASLLFFELCPH